MWERTVTVGSAGKTFSATGLKVMNAQSEYSGNVFFFVELFYHDLLLFRLAGPSALGKSLNVLKPCIKCLCLIVQLLLR